MNFIKTRPRAFVMILVLLLLVVLTVAVVGQLAVSQSQKIATLRNDEQMQARAIAEQCIARGNIYLDQIRASTQPVDFDGILDPLFDSHPVANGGTASMGDDYVPKATFGGTVVYVPPSEAGSAGLRQALHRYSYLPMGGGGCFVRFDDNSDDALPGVGGDNALPVIEGQGTDIPFRDADMGVFVTGIGVYPVSSATAAADAYQRAHARITLKQFVSTGGAPAVVANGDLTLETNVAVCGVGGFQGNNLTYTAGGSPATTCSCGDTATVAGASPPGDCTAAPPGDQCDPAIPCQPGAAVTLPFPPSVNVNVPTPFHWLQLDAFQDPQNPKGLGDNVQAGRNICEFYFRMGGIAGNTGTSDWTSSPLNNSTGNNNIEALYMSTTSPRGEVFVWDHTDDDAQGCKNAVPSTLAACPAVDVVTHDCTDPAMTNTSRIVNGERVVKRPCAWEGYTNAVGPTVRCNSVDPATMTVADSTPCWKLIATMSSGGVTDMNLQQDSTTLTGATGVGAGAAATLPVGDDNLEDTRPPGLFSETFSPRLGQRIPNIARYRGDPAVPAGNNGTVAFTPPGLPPVDFWQDFCGPCPNCDIVDGWGLRGDEHWHFERSPMCSNNFFDPAILVFENQPLSLATPNDQGRFHVKESWGNVGAGCAGPVRQTVIAQSHADIDLDTNLCGVYSTCTPVGVGQCNGGVANRANGYAVHAGGHCFVDQGAVFIGDMRCGRIDITQPTDPNDCIVGDLIAFNDSVAAANLPPNGVCASAAGFLPCTSGVCLQNAVNLVGNIISDGDICIQLGANITGSLLAGGDGTGNIFIANNTTITGQVVSEGGIGLKDNVTIINNGGGIFGARVNSSLRVESSY